MDMALEYSVMSDLFDEAVSAAMESDDGDSEFKSYMDTTKGAGHKVIAFIRFVLQKIIAGIRKLFAYIVNFFKHIKDGWGAVKDANLDAKFKIEVQRIAATWGPRYRECLKGIINCGIQGQRYAENAFGKVKSGKITSISDKIDELNEKVDEYAEQRELVDNGIKNAVRDVAEKLGMTTKMQNDVNFGKSKKNSKTHESYMTWQTSAMIKKTLEKDVLTYAKTADEKYSKLKERYDAVGENGEGGIGDTEGAQSLMKLNNNVNTKLKEVFTQVKNAGNAKMGPKIKGNLPETFGQESAMYDPLVNAILNN